MARFLPDLLVEGGRLELPGIGHRTATLVLEPGGIRLRAGDAHAAFEWEGSWRLTEWATNVYPAGLALLAEGPAERALAPVHAATSGALRAVLESLDDAKGTKVPLRTHGATSYEDIGTFDHLRTVLRSDARARARLADPDRLQRLRDDLARPLPWVADASSGILARKVDVQTAIRTLGYLHREGGRPMPGTVLDDRTSAIARVQDKLQQHAWTRDHPVTDEEVGKELDRIYYVEPWPFGALLLD